MTAWSSVRRDREERAPWAVYIVNLDDRERSGETHVVIFPHCFPGLVWNEAVSAAVKKERFLLLILSHITCSPFSAIQHLSLSSLHPISSRTQKSLAHIKVTFTDGVIRGWQLTWGQWCWWCDVVCENSTDYSCQKTEWNYRSTDIRLIGFESHFHFSLCSLWWSDELKIRRWIVCCEHLKASFKV